MPSVVVHVQPQHLAALPNFDIWIHYHDVARKPWLTSAKFLLADGGSYTEMNITERPM
jgi:hypothetical protein